MAKKENPLPQNLPLSKSITISTENSNGQNIQESHKITGPFNPDIRLVKLTKFNKAIIPIKDTLNEGDPVIKIHFPDPGQSRLFITFAKKSSGHLDGFADFLGENVSVDYKQDLKNWVARNSNNTSDKTRKLKFFAIGRNTNDPSKGIEFTVKFSNKTIGSIGSGDTISPELGS